MTAERARVHSARKRGCAEMKCITLDSKGIADILGGKRDIVKEICEQPKRACSACAHSVIENIAFARVRMCLINEINVSDDAVCNSWYPRPPNGGNQS